MESRTALGAVSLICPTKQQRPSSPSNPSGRLRATSKGLWTQGCSSKHVAGQKTERSGRTAKSWTCQERCTVFLQEGYPDSQLILKPYQQAQARFSAGARGLGLPPTESRQMSASIGNRVGILPEVLANLKGPLGEIVKRGLPESSIIAQLGGSLREVRDAWGVTKKAMPGIVSEYIVEWGLGAEGDLVPRPPEADMLASHDAVTTNSRKAQHMLGKLVKQGRHAARNASLEELPDTPRPPRPDDPLGGDETKAFAKARYSSLRGAGVTAFLRVRPTDSLRVIPAAEFVSMGRRSWRPRSTWQWVVAPASMHSTWTPTTHASFAEQERR